MKYSHSIFVSACLVGCAQAHDPSSSDWSYAKGNACPWTPFRLPFSTSCLASDPYSPSALQSKLGYGKIATAENGWNGPHLCLGRFCVWSNDGHGDGGASIVTTLSDKHEVARIPNRSPDAGHDASLFKAVTVPGKGIGLVATRRIRRGEEIMAIRPAVVVHEDLIDELELHGQNALLDQAARALPDARRQLLLAQVGELGGHRIADIMFTNSFQVAVGSKRQWHFGNFPEVSRLNHDCRPRSV